MVFFEKFKGSENFRDKFKGSEILREKIRGLKKLSVFGLTTPGGYPA